MIFIRNFLLDFSVIVLEQNSDRYNFLSLHSKIFCFHFKPFESIKIIPMLFPKKQKISDSINLHERLSALGLCKHVLRGATLLLLYGKITEKAL